MEQLCLQLVLPYEWHGDCLLNELNYVSSPQGLLLAEAQLITAVSPQVPNDALPWTERQGAPATPPACTWLEGALVSTSIKSPLYQLVPAQRRIVFGSSSWILLCLCLPATSPCAPPPAYFAAPLSPPAHFHGSDCKADESRTDCTELCEFQWVHPMASNPWKL